MARRVDPAFGPCDGVLFLALAWAGGRVSTLADVIGLYDWVNRAVPTAEELDGGLNRLIAAGLIEQHDDGFAVPVPVLDEFTAFRSRRRRDRFTTAEAFVRAAGPPAAVPRRVTVCPADQRRAYEEYCERFGKSKT